MPTLVKTLTFAYFQLSLDAHDRDLLYEADRQPDAIDTQCWGHFETAHNFILQAITKSQGPLLQTKTNNNNNNNKTKQNNKQTKKQRNKQTNKQINKQTNNNSNKNTLRGKLSDSTENDVEG